jgi:hypothetical protein
LVRPESPIGVCKGAAAALSSYCSKSHRDLVSSELRETPPRRRDSRSCGVRAGLILLARRGRVSRRPRKYVRRRTAKTLPIFAKVRKNAISIQMLQKHVSPAFRRTMCVGFPSTNLRQMSSTSSRRWRLTMICTDGRHHTGSSALLKALLKVQVDLAQQGNAVDRVRGMVLRGPLTPSHIMTVEGEAGVGKTRVVDTDAGPHDADPDQLPFEITIQGSGTMTWRRSACPGFNPALRDFASAPPNTTKL